MRRNEKSKYSFKPIINKNYEINIPFEERQKIFREKSEDNRLRYYIIKIELQKKIIQTMILNLSLIRLMEKLEMYLRRCIIIKININ